MRTLCTTVLCCLLSYAASAQTTLPSAPLLMGLPSASLPNQPTGIPVSPPPRDLFGADPDTYAPRFDRLLRLDPRFVPCCGGFPGVIFVPSKPSWASRSSFRRVPQARQFGHLQLLVQVGAAEVYVDGFYRGTVDDLRRRIQLEAGPHRIELRANGYETVTFDVRIEENATITYRTDLNPIRSAEKSVAAGRAVPKTFYVIANCYAGDKPPATTSLPPRCMGAEVRAIPPVVNDVRSATPAR